MKNVRNMPLTVYVEREEFHPLLAISIKVRVSFLLGVKKYPIIIYEKFKELRRYSNLKILVQCAGVSVREE